MSRSRPARAGYISDSELVRRAYALAEQAHGDQRRATDQTRFIEHVMEVGDLLHAAGFDERLVADLFATQLPHEQVVKGLFVLRLESASMRFHNLRLSDA